MKIDQRVLREFSIVFMAIVAPYTVLVIVVTLLIGWWSLLIAAGLGAASVAWYRQDKLIGTRMRLFLQTVRKDER